MGGPLYVAFNATTLWHFDAGEQGPSTPSLRAKRSNAAGGEDCSLYCAKIKGPDAMLCGDERTT